MNCQYPDLKRSTAYRYGCRCEECKAHKSSKERERVKRPSYICTACGGPAWNRNSTCQTCASSPAIERVMSRITVNDDGCWFYGGWTTYGGYGIVKLRSSTRSKAAHRVTYEHFVGAIPDGLELDHLCRVPQCVNPAHLEAVTHQENVRRYRRLATHCPNGHEYTVPAGQRRCQECIRERYKRPATYIRETA